MRLPIYILAFIATFPIFADQSKTAAENIQNYQMNLLLPVDHTSNPKYNVSLQMPKDFKPIQPVESFLHVSSIEYIPKTDTPNNWSEIITGLKHLNVRVTAKTFTDLMKQRVMQVDKASRVLSTSHTTISAKNSTITKSEIFIKYTMAKASYNTGEREEILGMVYYSGPLDCAGVQYTIHLKPGQSADEAIKKMQNFFDQNVKLFSF